MRKQNTAQRFVLVLSGAREPSEELEDALYEAGCDDALLVFRNQVGYLEFERVGDNFQEAVLSALEETESAGLGISVDHVEPGDLVNASEIGRRLSFSREYVRLLIAGKRGKGAFPIPISGVVGSLTLWSWAEVASYLHECGMMHDEQIVRDAEFIRNVNARWLRPLRLSV